MRVIRENKIEKFVKRLGRVRAGSEIDLGVELNQLLEDADEWAPITTAPEDERILIFYPKFGVFTGQINKGVFNIDSEREQVARSLPTHWQKLPKGPKP